MGLDPTKYPLGYLGTLLSELAPANHLAPTQDTYFGGLINSLPKTPNNTLLGAGLINSLPVPPTNALFGALGVLPETVPSLLSGPPAPSWRYVRARFNRFLANIAISPEQNAAARTQQAGVIACLNRHYFKHGSETLNGTLIGSWGKDTRTKPLRDADILFVLPNSVYWQYEGRTGNRQSQLLQEVKGVLGARYPRTDLRGDGQVVIVPFSPPIEVVPAFRCKDGSIIICDTNDGGRYRASTAAAEHADLNFWDQRCHGNVRALIRMMKTWQRSKSVDIKSFHIERLAIEFLQGWANSFRDVYFYDWMVRDFLGFMIGRANGWIFMPGTGEAVFLGDGWLGAAKAANKSAIQACDYERDSYEALAGSEWQDIFGTAIPLLAS